MSDISYRALMPFCDPRFTHTVYREYGGGLIRLWAETAPRALIEREQQKERELYEMNGWPVA